MTVDSQVTNSRILPTVFLIDIYSDQVGHHFSESTIVVSFYPHHLDLTLRIGELTNVSQELPVFFLEPAKIQVRKNVTQQDQSPERTLLQHTQGITRAADFRAEVKVREDSVSHTAPMPLVYPM